MTQWDGQSELAELAHLPPSHPARAELESRISLMDSVAQERWRNILRETDAMYRELAQAPVPVELEERLLRIPSTRAAGRGRLERFLAQSLGWKHLAACALIAVGILAFIYWPRSVPAPPLQTLDPALAEKIAALAVQHSQGQASLEISSNDAGKVRTALASQNLPISVTVSAPRANLVLSGGGTCEFGPTRAACTRWQANGLNYTLFQFSGKALCVPSAFLATAVPTALGPGAVHYHVVIWPGNGEEGDWAMVLENDAALNAFMTRNCR
jgi:hypothetical protein